jgi:DNA-binding NarL/FixJ family response regulator
VFSAELANDPHASHPLRPTLPRENVSLLRPSEIASHDAAGAVSAVLIEHRLTRRELEVVQLLQQALTNRDIAEKLMISERTVAAHVSNALGKLALKSRTQLALWALQRGISPVRLASVQEPFSPTRYGAA